MVCEIITAVLVTCLDATRDWPAMSLAALPHIRWAKEGEAAGMDASTASQVRQIVRDSWRPKQKFRFNDSVALLVS